MLATIRVFARNATLATALVSCTGALALAGEGEPIRSFGAVQTIFTQSCALPTCHSTVARQGNLSLDHEELSYENLVDKESFHPDANRQRLRRVQSGSAGNSFLIRKLRGQGPGDRMPQNAPPLSEDQIKMIEDWINRGAHSRAEECVTSTTEVAAAGAAAARRELPDGNKPKHGLHIDPTLCSDVPVEGDYDWEPEPALEVPAAGEGVQLYVPPKDVAPGTEWETCYAFRVKDLPNAAVLRSTLIERQEYRMHSGSHHLLLYMYFGQDPEGFKEGFFDCSAGNCINDDECPDDAGMFQFPIGGTQVAGTRYVVNYPPGAGLPLLGNDNTVLIANLHYTNPFQPQQDIYGEAWINLYVYEPDQFKVVLDGIFAINAADLIVEPYEKKTIQRLWRPRSFLGGGVTDAAVFQLFGHMHKRGLQFDIDYVPDFCTGDCNADASVGVDELVRGVTVALGSARIGRCGNADEDRDGAVGINELISAVDHSLSGCSPDTLIYKTSSWDAAPVQEYASPFLLVNRDQALRWSCIHENGRLLQNGEEDPTYPAKKCHQGCRTCGWDEATRTCVFARGSNPARTYQEGEPMPLVFGELADDDMCNMFGYFIRQEDLPNLP